MNNKEEIIKLYEDKIDEIYERTTYNLDYNNKIKLLEDELIEALTDEQKEKLLQINQYKQQNNEQVCKNVFITAFSLATKLFVEGLKEN